MRIGIDLDEVLGYFLPAFIEWHNDIYKTHWKIEEFYSYYSWDVYNFPREEGIKKLYEFFETPYFKNIKPTKGSQEAVKILKKDNELFIITARQEIIIEETRRWVAQYFPNIFSEIYFANHFSQSGKPKTKKETCDFLDIDVLIEDSAPYASECLAPSRKIFLFDYPWNRAIALPGGIKRVHSWEEILEKIGK